MPERASLFEDDTDFDISAFAPKKSAKSAPDAEAVREVSESANFKSREPVAKPMQKADRRHRTGRNVQLNTKVTQKTSDMLYAIHDLSRGKENWTLGEIIERALEALQKELKRRGDAR